MIADVVVDIGGLAENDCRILLERRPEADVIHLRHREYPGQDCAVTLPATQGTDRESAAESLGRAVREGRTWIHTAIGAGILEVEECQRIVDDAQESDRSPTGTGPISGWPTVPAPSTASCSAPSWRHSDVATASRRAALTSLPPSWRVGGRYDG